jgi:hypothetical protein
LIGDDRAWHRVRAQHTLEEAFGGGFVAPILQQDVEFDAVLVDCTPQQERFTTQALSGRGRGPSCASKCGEYGQEN